MTKQEADSLMLSKSEQGKDGMTVVKLGYVRDLLDKLFDDKFASIGISTINQTGGDNTNIEFYGVSKDMQRFNGNIEVSGFVTSPAEAIKVICKIFGNVKEYDWHENCRN